MKSFTSIFILFFSSTTFADIYYCAEEQSMGFIPLENFREVNYTEEDYIIEIDFENLTIDSDELGMPEEYSICKKFFYHKNVMQCSSPIGGRDFTLNSNTLIFTYTTTYITDEMEDGLGLSWGKCQKF